MNMTHTPGPWIVGGESSNDAESEFVCNADGSKTICWTADTYNEDKDEGEATDEDRANARLIAASPELLEALKAAVAVMTGWSYASIADAGDTETVRLCKAAIAKAEGRAT